jgi:proteasome lid subunit RPN8/RPN11
VTSPKTKNDIDRIVLGELRTAEFPAPESMETYRVHILPEVHEQILKHSRESLKVELCGVLVGEPFQDRKGAWLKIEAAIRGEHSSSESAQVTFTQETWAHIHREMDTKYPSLRIVGWYHTHPGFGIFLSSMDLFIQENFFNLPGQVAFVVDPRSADEGFFCWKNGETKRMNHYWVGDKEKLCRPSATASSGDLAEKVRHLEKELQALRRYFEGRLTQLRWWGMMLSVALAVVVAAILFVSGQDIVKWVAGLFKKTP